MSFLEKLTSIVVLKHGMKLHFHKHNKKLCFKMTVGLFFHKMTIQIFYCQIMIFENNTEKSMSKSN